MQPIWHWRPEGVQAHLVVASLALLLSRLLERKLKTAGEDLSVKAALKALETIRLVEFKIEQGNQERIVTRGSQ